MDNNIDNREHEEKRRACPANELSTRLNRIEGQVRGIKGMIENGACCNSVLNQILAARAALNSVAKIVLGGFIEGCLSERKGQSEAEISDEILSAMGKLL